MIGHYRSNIGGRNCYGDGIRFGFITPDDGGAHFSEVQAKAFKSLQENQKVSFDVK